MMVSSAALSEVISLLSRFPKGRGFSSCSVLSISLIIFSDSFTRVEAMPRTKRAAKPPSIRKLPSIDPFIFPSIVLIATRGGGELERGRGREGGSLTEGEGILAATSSWGGDFEMVSLFLLELPFIPFRKPSRPVAFLAVTFISPSRPETLFSIASRRLLSTSSCSSAFFLASASAIAFALCCKSFTFTV